jgi:1-acyl-sn-glycerol-3-phosphate acyltransferase/phosphopantetheinyl transferase (holo-ACP synthase)
LALTCEDIRSIRLQRFWSRAAAAPIYVLLDLTLRWRFGYSYRRLSAFRRDIWEKLDRHQGPVIWAANHHTLIDSFLIFQAVYPFWRLRRHQLIPWSTPEYTNYYNIGGWLCSRTVRFFMYLCRCIPFLREGEDAVAVAWREKAFAKCAWVLNQGGAVFIYPEAQRSRNGWIERRRPKDFLGRLALETPQAKFLCVYLRGERQVYRTVYPERDDSFRMAADLVPAVLPGETTPRQVSQRLFDTLARLQDEWFKDWNMPKNCGGNDVVDLKSPLRHENMDPETGEADPEWLARHLTRKEASWLESQPPRQRYRAFWKMFAAKEAAHKALRQAGIDTPRGGYRQLETDLFRRKVLHLPSGVVCDLAFTNEDEDKVHCLAVMRGGYIGDEETPGDLLWGLDELPPGVSPHEYVRSRCLALIAGSNDEIGSPDKLAFSEENGIPKVLHGGKPADWGVSLSHSGRFVAYSFMIS